MRQDDTRVDIAVVFSVLSLPADVFVIADKDRRRRAVNARRAAVQLLERLGALDDEYLLRLIVFGGRGDPTAFRISSSLSFSIGLSLNLRTEYRFSANVKKSI
jgi:hypothetical protein